ncbi:hypothetical protein RL72_01142 [Microbacterium azadirachtae]|uniref:Uncharacterized protein n=1 Tax=Microbacterium azadirachtae TaxID=582680 RepID=A0A0F0KZ93_9MICO|nr:hypothetical protein [Microbacterium azadirachtae]KJL26207.1 hypothetical protein RL72_01142 [Microbacterium azadirachtae]
MSAGEDEAELVRRIKAEEIITYRRARGPLTPKEQAEGAEALREFQERVASGWYDEPSDEEALS